MRLADPLYPPRSASAIPESLTQPSTHPIHIVRIVDLTLIADWRIVRHPGLRPRQRPARFVLSSKRHPCTGLPGADSEDVQSAGSGVSPHRQAGGTDSTVKFVRRFALGSKLRGSSESSKK